MSHARQQIREAVTTLVTGLNSTGGNVFQSRVYRIQQSELPALLIYTTDEEVSRSSFSGGNELERVLGVRVEGFAQATANLDDTLDTIQSEVEEALGGELPAGVEDFYLTSASSNLTGEGEKPIGTVAMDFLCRYRTSELNPETIL